MPPLGFVWHAGARSEWSKLGLLTISALNRKRAIRAAWIALAIAYFSPSLLHHANYYDEGFMVCGAERVLHGQLPYQDFNSGYPPGPFYTVAAVFRLFGTSLLAERVLDVFWRLGIVACSICLIQAACGRIPLAVSLCLSGWIGVITFHLYPMITGTLFCVAALWLSVLYLNGRGRKWMYFSGGVAGAGFFYRHDLMLCICGAVTLTAAYQLLVQKDRAALRGFASFVTGVITVFAPGAMLLWISVPHAALQRSFIEFPKITAGQKFLKFYTLSSIWDVGTFYLPLAIVVFTACRLWMTKAERRPVPLLLFLSAVSTLAVAIQRSDVPHAFPAIVVGLILLCWNLSQPLLLRKEVAGFCRTAFVGAVLLWYGLPALAAWTVDAAAASHPKRSGIPRAGPIPLDQDQIEAVQYIQRQLAPGRPLYVGTTSHSRVFMNDALFYFLADRPQATGWDMWVPGLTSGAEVQSEIADALEKKRIEYLVVFAARESHEPNRSVLDSGITTVDDDIRNHYSEVARFGRYTISRRIPD
jgi:hypothetical protein